MTQVSTNSINENILGDSSQSKLSDGEIVQQVKLGDLNAFEMIMRRYNQRLYRIARGIIKDNHDAEDIVQEAYIKAYTTIESLNNDARFGAWLTKITINEALMRLRKNKRIILEDSPATFANKENLISNQPNPEQLAENREFKILLEAAIDTLSDNFRTVFILRAIEQLSIAETAEYLDIKPATVKTRLHRARRLLKQQLNIAVDQALMHAYEFGGKHCDRIVSRVLLKLETIKSEDELTV